MLITARGYTDTRIDQLLAQLHELRTADAAAIIRAREEMSHRLDGMNEFRAALASQTATFVPRPEVEATQRRIVQRLDELSSQHLGFVGRSEHDALADRISAIDVRMTRQEGTDVGAATRMATLRQTIIISVAVLGLMITMFVTILDHIK